MEWYIYILIVTTGIAVGFINTLAGSGSLITLPLLVFLGLPSNVANGTNRIGILFQSIVSSFKFKQKKVFEWNEAFFITIPAVIGAIPGAFIATKVPKETLNYAIGFLLIFMFFIVWLKPEQWLKGKAGLVKARPGLLQFVIYFLIGLYGGFIQAGVGFFLLAALVLSSGYDLVKANALKVFITGTFTLIVLPIFIYFNQVNYLLGGLLAVGSMAGAWIGTKIAIKKGAIFIRYFLLIIIFISAFKLLIIDIFF
ncbi:MAG: hypothetical protein A2X08_07745 [Bacteroidetes bacterium GWA2_32_17]|nr:MAG: hypothetical protein A2X08_07745 [Bacteroidetes bacterium GWA2_32_17]